MYAPVPDPIPPAEPARPRTAERIAALFEVFLVSGIPTQIFLIGILTGFGMAMQTSEGTMSPTFVFTVSLLDAALVITVVVMLLRARRESVRDVLIGNRRILREVLYGIALIPLVFMLVIAVMLLVLTYAPSLRNVPQNPLESLIRNQFDAMIFAIVVMVAGGVREEVQRGFIVHRFDGFLGGGMVGVVVYSLLFGLGHFEQGWDATLATGLLGILWGTIYLRRRSIIAPMVSHAGFNLAQVVKAVVLRGAGGC